MGTTGSDKQAISLDDIPSPFEATASADSDAQYCLNVDDYLQELRQKYPWRDYLSRRLSS